jgi:hypothetical protein
VITFQSFLLHFSSGDICVLKISLKFVSPSLNVSCFLETMWVYFFAVFRWSKLKR